MMSPAEDTILMKLRWSAKSGGSERQVTDARHVYEQQAGSLDEAHLDEWSTRLGVREGFGGDPGRGRLPGGLSRSAASLDPATSLDPNGVRRPPSGSHPAWAQHGTK